MDRKKELLWRAYLVMFLFIIVSITILVRVFTISVIEQKKWVDKGNSNVQWRVVDADRGDIYAEGGNLLSTSIVFFEVRMDMKVIKKELFESEVDSLASFLANFDEKYITKRSKSVWKSKLVKAYKNQSRYFYIGKNLDISAYNLLKNAPILRHGTYKGGFIKARYGKRIKPFGEFASRTIGLDRENADKIGLEGYFDKFLEGPKDQRLMKRMCVKCEDKDTWLPVYDPSEHDLKRGDDIFTTINIGMQDAVHHELLKAVQHHKAESGVAILMEVATGAIKGISNLTKTGDSTYIELYNHAVARLSEPGSTMKLATMLAAMEDKYANPDTLINVNYGVKKFADRNMYDSEKHGKHFMTMSEAFELSSNVGVASIANELYNARDSRKKWVARLKQFGLNEPTGIEIPGEPRPEIKDPEKDKNKWYATTIPWMAHGYELMMTPLQMLNFYNSVANQGRMMKPYIVDEIRKGDEIKKKFDPMVLKESIASPGSISAVQNMMKNVVIKGTATNLKSNIVSMAGKTGTARTNYANKADYARYNASFCGYFPAENPTYSMIVVIYDPRNGAYYGGSVAGPVFKNVAERVMMLKTQQSLNVDDIADSKHSLPTKSVGNLKDFREIYDYLELKYNKPKNLEWAMSYPSEGAMKISEKKLKKMVVPDVVGMGARDAIYLMENAGLKPYVKGVGKVVSQSISVNSAARGQNVYLTLN